MLIKLLLLATIASGQTTPEQIKDKATSEVAEYLSQEIRKNRAKTDSLASDILNGASVFNGNITFNSSVTFSGGVFGNSYVYASTVTRVPATTTAQQTFGVSITSLTLTLPRAAQVLIWYSGNGFNNGGNGTYAVASFKQDNTFIDGLSSTIGASATRIADTSPNQDLSFWHVTESSLAAGTYTFAITIRATAAGGTVNFVNDSTLSNQFGAREL